MLLRKLPGFVGHGSKETKTLLLLQNHCKKINQQYFSKWKKMNSCCVSCSTFVHQQRRMGTQKIPSEIKSPFRNLDIPNITITELLWDKIDRFPDHTAIECGITGRKYTFAQIRKLSQKFAVSLLKSGVLIGQTVAIVTPNCPEYPIVAYGCLEAGFVITLINHMLTVDEISYQLKDSGTVCVVASLNNLETIRTAATKVKDANKSNNEIKVLVLDVNGNDSIEIPSRVGRFSELITESVDGSDLHNLRNSVINTSDIAILPYSSGTTGLPKGVQLSHKNIVSNIYQINEASDTIETTKDHQDVLPGILPFYHIYGFTAILTKSIFLGNKIVTLPKFEPKTFLDTLKNQKCTCLYIVPPLMIFLGSQEVTQEYLQHIRLITTGAAPLGANDLEKCLKKIPKENNISIQQAYGLTECSTCLTYPPKGSNLSTVGAPVSNTMVKIVSVENGETLGPNQNGEVWGKGPQVMVGYHNNPKATAATVDSEGWLHTGDVGYYDENGLFYIVDRIKELIKVKGLQVAPAELEELLRALPGVKDAGVVGVPNERSGEVPIAFVVQSSSNPASVSDIKTFISQKAAPYKQLSDIVFVDAIPKSPSGKILRRVIKEIYLNSKSN